MTLRICNNCQQRKNNATGSAVNNPGGLTYKWFCQDCTTKRNENERFKKIMVAISQSTSSNGSC
jgi:protein-arginine kinase activator protein McsA